MGLSCGFVVGALIAVSSGSAVVASPAVFQVPVSVAGDCLVDVTQPILSWVASVPNNSVLSFGGGACYRIEGTLELRGRSGLVFEGNGSTFRSLNAPDDQRAIWRAIDSTNLVFRDMTIDGSYANGGTFTSSLQHAHGIDLRGTSAEVASVTMTDLAGDCVYFGLGFTSALTRSSGSVHDSSCLRTSRNAVSVTAGDDIRIERVTTSVIGYDVYDIEPNAGPGWGSQRVTITDNTIGSYNLVAFSIVPNGPITDQTFSNNRVVGRGLKIATGTGAYRPSNVTITDNSADTAQAPAAMNLSSIDGLTVTGNTVPLTGGTMAAVDNSCNANVSGNSYTGGSSEVTITNTPSSCPAPAPTISAFSPSSGGVGTSVTISGSGFTGATAVAFNGTNASFTVDSDTQVTATVPVGATSGPISITTPGGTATSGRHFRVKKIGPAAEARDTPKPPD